MLEPQERHLLLEALRPPSGYELSLAIGTTFSLDLLALLTAPVAFTLFEHDSQRADPLKLLHTMRHYAEKICVFCQAGQIKIPTQHRLLYSYLEDSVFEIASPRAGGVFHPKVWALRYQAEGEPTIYRLLVLSRNLTFDRSWDTALVLEGIYSGREYRSSLNYPLGDFLAALGDMTIRRLPGHVQDKITTATYEIQRVDWEVPNPFSQIKFWALGLPRKVKKWPFEDRIDRMLIISPFASEEMLSKLTANTKDSVLVSRAETLEELPPSSFSRFESIYALNPGISTEEDFVDEAQNTLQDVPLSGLHAKLYIADMGWDARLWTGSANATNAAFFRNVEFLVELRGRKSKMGIDVLLQESRDGQVLFRDMLEPISERIGPSVADPTRKRLEKRLRMVRQALASTGLELHIQQSTEDQYELLLDTVKPVPELNETDIWCWPITLEEDRASVRLDMDNLPLRLGPLSFEALSSFIAFSIQATEGDETLEVRFALNLPLHNAPAGRQERILEAMLRSRDQVMRFLLILLSDDEMDAVDAISVWQTSNSISMYGSTGVLQIPLFEALVKTLASDPNKLDQIHQLVEDLRKTEGGAGLLPPDFGEIWEPIWQARLQLEGKDEPTL